MLGLSFRVKFLWLPRWCRGDGGEIKGLYWFRFCVETYSEDLGWVLLQKVNHQGLIGALILTQGVELTYRHKSNFTLSGPPREVEMVFRKLLSSGLVEYQFLPEHSILVDDELNEKYIYLKSKYLQAEIQRYFPNDPMGTTLII